MKKITKLFLVIFSVASLSVTSVFAGDLNVTGGVTATYKVNGADQAAGKGMGVSNELDFNASGELDNGYAWTWQTQLDGASTLNDDTKLTITAGEMGTIGMFISEGGLSSKFGYGVGAMGVGSDYTGPSSVEHGINVDGYNNVQYHTPAGLMPFGITAKVGYVPNLVANDGASAKADGLINTGATGKDMTQVRLDAKPIDGLEIGADYANTSGALQTVRYNAESGGAYAKYSIGSFTVGAAVSAYQPTENTGGTANAQSSIHYETEMYGVQMAVNDALSISYSEEKATKATSSELSGVSVRTSVDDIDMKIKHIQAAYTVGGATVGLAIADADDADYVVGKAEKTTTFSLAIAF